MGDSFLIYIFNKQGHAYLIVAKKGFYYCYLFALPAFPPSLYLSLS